MERLSAVLKRNSTSLEEIQCELTYSMEACIRIHSCIYSCRIIYNAAIMSYIHACRLGGNPIGEEGAKHLIAGINENRTLKEVWYVCIIVLYHAVRFCCHNCYAIRMSLPSAMYDLFIYFWWYRLENVKLSKEMKSALQRLNSSREGLLVSFENCWKHRKEKHIGQHFHIDI